MRLWRLRSRISRHVALLVLGLLACAPTSRRSERILVIATATKGGTYDLVGQQLAKVVERIPDGPVRAARALTTAGSIENLELLAGPRVEGPGGEKTAEGADLAFVNLPALDRIRDDAEMAGKVRAVTAVLRDVIQVVVRKDVRAERLADLEGRRIYVGKDASGTRLIAEALLEMAGVADYEPRGTDQGYSQASERLVEGVIDAAIFASGTPTVAVRSALESGDCHLLSLADLVEESAEAGYEEFRIPASFYAKQQEEVRTLTTWAILCCRRDLPDHLVETILDTLVDRIDELLLEHSRVQDIRLGDQTKVPEFLAMHPGAARFWHEEKDRLVIATGAISGKYYRIGKAIHQLLEQRGIASRVRHTDGSLENAAMLSERPTLAVLQYDVALAAYWGVVQPIYRTERLPTVATVKEMRRIAALHEEKLHILVRRPEGEPLSGGVDALLDPRLDNGVSLGPKRSGTRIVAQALLMQYEEHGEQLKILDRIRDVPLAVPETVFRLRGEEISGAFFLSGIPSEALKATLADPAFRLLSVDAASITGLTAPAFRMTVIEPDRYLCQREGEGPVTTIATRAVLVTTADLDEDLVATITSAIVGGLGYLPVSLERKDLVADLAIPLHPGAEASYREARILPPDPPSTAWLQIWLGITWRTLACLVILFGAYRGLLKLRRDRTGNAIGRRVNAVSLAPSEPFSVTKLREIQDEILERVRRRWWRRGEIDRRRWRTLNTLIEERIAIAREQLFRALIAEGRRLGDDPATFPDRATTLGERIWKHVEEGELEPEQRQRLHAMLEDLRSEVAAPRGGEDGTSRPATVTDRPEPP